MSKTIRKMMNFYRILAVASILCGLALIVLVLIGYFIGDFVSVWMAALSAVLVGLFLARFVLAYQMDTLKKQEFINMMKSVVKNVKEKAESEKSSSEVVRVNEENKTDA